MGANYETIRKMCESINFPSGKLTDEYLFTIYETNLFFYEKNIGIIDIKTNFTDGKGDGGIDFVYTDNDTLYLIQGKTSDSLSTREIKDVFNKMAETVAKFEDKNYSEFSPILKSAYQIAYDDLGDDKIIEFVLFTHTELNEKMRKDVSDFAKTDPMSGFKITIYDEKDLQNKEEEASPDSDLVKKGEIALYLENGGGNNILSYGNSGIIVNVKASSIKLLYEKYAKKGLFSYNLREYITAQGPGVDKGIDETIEREKELFWFYNNGITIGCEDFSLDGDKIQLYGFSIINGAQTTTRIGMSKQINDKNYDFAVVCKIVKAEKSLSQAREFINRISEASNSQKSIKSKDLKANAPEQQHLQRICAKNGEYSLAIEIKRGVRPENYANVEKWQRVKNDYLGQLIYAGILQHPGTARNAKNIMFTSPSIYKDVFRRNQDCDTLFDLVRLGSTYEQFAEKFAEENDDTELIALVRNGKLTVLGVTLYLVKKQRGIVKNASSPNLHKDNISGLLISDYTGDDLDQKLNELFRFITSQLQDLYKVIQVSMKITSYSNFFKSDPIYEDEILRKIDSLDAYEHYRGLISSFMEVFEKK